MTSKEGFDIIVRYVPTCFKDELEIIEKDLKCGETCKKMLNMILQSFKVSIDRFKKTFKNEREFEMFKEWLENE